MLRYTRGVIPSDELHSLFSLQGLDLVGVASADPDEKEEARYREQLAEGHGADMLYLERHAGLKFAPQKALPGCRSILSVGLGYYVPEPAPGTPAPAGHGRIARYAWCRDYHKVLGDRLRAVARTLERRMPGERAAAHTDATPLAERYYAERAGIGFTGRNGLLISSSVGSWLVIGEILTTASLTPSEPAAGRHGACPPSCRRCIAACPTGALVSPGCVDSRRCVSYLTIENKGSIPLALRPLVGDWLFGCDICQEVCPYNQRPAPTGVRDFTRLRAGPYQEVRALLGLRDHADVVHAFAGSPLVRAGRRGLVRNACVVAGNSRLTALVPRLRELRSDSDEAVAEHAAWALATLSSAPWATSP